MLDDALIVVVGETPTDLMAAATDDANFGACNADKPVRPVVATDPTINTVGNGVTSVDDAVNLMYADNCTVCSCAVAEEVPFETLFPETVDVSGPSVPVAPPDDTCFADAVWLSDVEVVVD